MIEDDEVESTVEVMREKGSRMMKVVVIMA